MSSIGRWKGCEKDLLKIWHQHNFQQLGAAALPVQVTCITHNFNYELEYGISGVLAENKAWYCRVIGHMHVPHAKHVELEVIFPPFQVLLRSWFWPHHHRCHLANWIFAAVFSSLNTQSLHQVKMHVEDTDCSWAKQLRQLLADFSMKQHITVSTHTHIIGMHDKLCL